MTGRDNHLWQQCWRDRRLDFHQKTVNPLLMRFWPSLELSPTVPVLVPLCGKSLDLLWLARRGHAVIGVELSPIAVRAFFRENRLQATRRQAGRLTLWQSGNVAILCGDFFALTAADIGVVGAVYDRAALTALPEDIRGAYLAHLCQLVAPDCKMLLLTTEEPEEGETPEQALAGAEEIQYLYGPGFQIELAHVEGFLEADAGGVARRVEHKVYRLTARRQPGPIRGSGCGGGTEPMAEPPGQGAPADQ